MKQEELKEIIEKHQLYLAQDCEGWEEMKADLIGANLSGANLREANLSEANLSETNLVGADLVGANLSRANLVGANLSEANLVGANLIGANLVGANLVGANLSGAYLSGANLSGANISGVIYDCYTAFFAISCPEEGDFIGWKKTMGFIIKIRVPADAKRSSATTRKCRCSHAEVLEIQNLDGSKAYTDSVTNASYVKTTYTVGETVHADSWDEDRWNECSHGIHFFITRDEAVNY